MTDDKAFPIDEKLYRLLVHVRAHESVVSLDPTVAQFVCGTSNVSDLASVINEAETRKYIDRWSSERAENPGPVTEEHVERQALVGATVSRFTGHNILAHRTGARVV
jgi:hypothetical protein